MESPETVGVQVHEKMRGQEAQTKPRRHLIRTPGHEPSSATTRDVMTSEDVRLEVHNKRPRCHCFICEDLHGDNWYSGSQSADGGWIMSNIRTKVHSIRKSADQGCDVSKCLLQALEMLGDNVHKVDLGYRENQGILYIMSAGSDPYTATGLTEDLLWERDRVNIYPPSSIVFLAVFAPSSRLFAFSASLLLAWEVQSKYQTSPRKSRLKRFF